MSYRSLLTHRCTVKRLEETFVDGMPQHQWVVKGTAIPCRVDLQFIRQGKDPLWTPEAGRASDRTGVLFIMPSSQVKSGDRIFVSRGPAGTFQIEGAVDEAWDKDTRHHIELGIKEVSQQVQ